AHTLQHVFGCDLLDDGSTRGYRRYAHDGRDFIAFDADSMMFTAADAAGELSRRRWESRAASEECKVYLESECAEWLRRYVSYGRAVLERKEPPTVRVSGKEAHGILTLRCRAY
ncbi:HA1F protein, partial [Rhinopomastus cyanomelas]|nr:HA1F protein [Rhinopomastus cyanomelas]